MEQRTTPSLLISIKWMSVTFMKSNKNHTASSLRVPFLHGLAGGIAATLLLFVGSSLFALPFPPEGIFQLLIAPVPGTIQSVVVETFREYAKYSTFVFSAAVYAVMYAVLSVLIVRLFGQEPPTRRYDVLVTAVTVPSLIALGLDALLSARSSALASPTGWLISGLLILGVNLVYASSFVQRIWPAPKMQVIAQAEPASSSSRRGFIKKAAIVAAVLVVAGVVARVGLNLLSGEPVITSGTPIPVNNQQNVTTLQTQTTVQSETTLQNETALQELPAIFQDERIRDLVNSEITDNRIFYRVDIDPIPPQLDFNQWSLKITGKVNSPLTLNKDSLMALQANDEYVTLECVSNTINPPGALISNAKWTGVPLPTVLNQAGIAPEAKYVVFHCADGYTVGIPLDRAMKSDALLAYKMNDELLPNGHGFPLRAIVPGIYGMMNAKWVTEIELVDQVYLGYWQDRGWSNDARIKTTSIIYYPSAQAQVSGPIPIAGVAFAGDRRISKVEVSTDGGNTWNEATLKKSPSPYSWVLWAYEWTPTTKGSVTVTVRAYDGAGTVQDPTPVQPFPDGASGYNSIQVSAT
jgi:DMSO/TMAO reductase YedYZ molybdopterin-dependent catalytic subunit